MLSKIYISAPITTDWSTVVRFKKALDEGKFKVSVWDRNSKYKQSEFDDSDAVVFLLPDNKFDCVYDKLPIGLKNELSRAYAQSKKLYVGYRTTSGDYNIYDADSNGRSIRALKGTAANIFDLSKSNKLQKSLDRAAEKIVINGRYGAATILGLDQGSNPCAEIELPKGPTGSVGRPGITGVAGIEYDERLLLMM